MTAPFFVRLRRWWHKANRSERPAREVFLNLETLEKRTVPSANLNDTFLATVYQGELSRNIDPAGLTYWEGQLATNSRTQVVQGILGSNEALTDQLGADYGSLLGRAPDAAGYGFYLSALQQGVTPQAVQASIMGSDEFFTRVGSTGDQFLNAVYGEVLGRGVDAAGAAYWTPLTNSVAGRTQIVSLIEASPEAAQRDVTTLYQDTLGRVPDAGGLAYWSAQLESGASQTNVLAGVLGSNEFYSRMQSYVAPLNTTDPNAAAAAFITAGHLFQSHLPVVPAFVQSGGVMYPPDNSVGTPSPDNPVNVIPNDIPNDIPVDTTPIYVPVDTTPIDTGTTDNSTVDNTTTDSPDCGCDNSYTDPGNYSTDPGTTDNSGGTSDPTFDGSDPNSGF